MQYNRQCHASGAFPEGKSPSFSLDKRLDGPQSQSKRKTFLAPKESLFLSCPATIAIPTELSRLLILKKITSYGGGFYSEVIFSRNSWHREQIYENTLSGNVPLTRNKPYRCRRRTSISMTDSKNFCSNFPEKEVIF
jgi:hypothetical protein